MLDGFDDAAGHSSLHCYRGGDVIADRSARREYDEPFAPRDSITARCDRFNLERRR